MTTVSSNHSLDTTLPKEIGARVRRLRKKKLVSQAELARRIGVTQSAISQIEKGHRTLINLAVFAKISHGLEISMADLLTGHGHEKHLENTSPVLSALISELLSLPINQQNEIVEAIHWIMAWRYGLESTNVENISSEPCIGNQ